MSRASRTVLLLCLAVAAGCETTINLGDPADAGSAASAHDAADAPTDGPIATPDGGATDASAGSKGFFVTRATYAPDLGGLDGADFRCQSSAMAAGFGGKWKAWVSDSTHDAADRILSDGPWIAVITGVKVFNDHANLRGFPLAPLATDELGRDATDRWWTGTRANGVRSANTCVGWSVKTMSSAGTTGTRVVGASVPGKEWTEDVEYSCQSALALLCFEDQ